MRYTGGIPLSPRELLSGSVRPLPTNEPDSGKSGTCRAKETVRPAFWDIKIAGFRIVFVLKATLCLLLEFVRIVLCLKGNTKTDNEGDNEVVNSHNLNFNVRQIYAFLCNREYENVRFLSQEPRVLEFSRLLFVRRSGSISRFRQEIIIKMTIWER